MPKALGQARRNNGAGYVRKTQPCINWCGLAMFLTRRRPWLLAASEAIYHPAL
jgi:hypothetical protein